MSEDQTFDVAAWSREMRREQNTEGRMAVLERTGILERDLSSATAIHRAIVDIAAIVWVVTPGVREPLVMRVMQVAQPGNGWYEYYQNTDRSVDAIANMDAFLHHVSNKQYDMEKMGQILLAIARSDLEMLKAIGVDMNGRVGCKKGARDLFLRAVYQTFDPKIFRWLDTQLWFSNNWSLLRRCWRKSISDMRLQLFRAISEIDGFLSEEDLNRGLCKILDSAFGACLGVTNLEAPEYQMLEPLVPFLLDLAPKFEFVFESKPESLKRKLAQYVSNPQARGIIIWCLGKPINYLFNRYQIIEQARVTTDPEMLILAMNTPRINTPRINTFQISTFQISTSDLMKWCDQQGDDYDPSWFATVLKKKSARSIKHAQ